MLKIQTIVSTNGVKYFRSQDGKFEMETSNHTCHILAKNATETDEGIWELLVGSGKDLDTFEKKSIFYKIIVKGN